jgi:UDP-N-acetylmuramate: L-alanyl-gamma-D-glutamyl-meso-diaminopimelate ligase
LAPITPAQIREAFQKDGLMVYTDSQKLMECLAADEWEGCNLLIMTSGNFDGQEIRKLAVKITGVS